MMTNPEWEMLERENLHTSRIVPIYPLTKGLSARTLRRLMHHAVDTWANRIPDYLPESVLERTELPELSWALPQAHFPELIRGAHHAAPAVELRRAVPVPDGHAGQRRDWQAVPGQPLHVDEVGWRSISRRLPYALTGAQRTRPG